MPSLHRWVVSIVVTAVVVVPAPPGEAASAARATCQGQAATIVGDRDTSPLEGTDGDDVIVTRGSMEVAAGGGDDVICVTGRAQYPDGYQEVFVDAGPGDDSVTTALDAVAVAYVQLGPGADDFTGGTESDFVSGDVLAFGDDDAATDADPDTIDTGTTGLDYVFVGDGGPLADQVRVASAYGRVQVAASSLAEDGSLQGGARTDLVVVDGSAAASGSWSLDLATSTAALDAEPAFTWSGFDRIAWAVPGTIDLQGTDGVDVVSGPVVSGDLGGGDDKVYAWSSRTDHGAHDGVLDGGTGTDQVRFFAGSVYDDDVVPGGGLVPFTPTDVTVDVAHQRTTYGDGQVVPFAGFEWYGAQTNAVATLVGGPGDDLLYGSACDLRMKGGAGDDRLRQMPKVGSAGFTNPSCRGHGGGVTATLAGGAGDDSISVEARTSTLSGGSGNDALLGGSGRDRLLGGGGDDRLLGDGGADEIVGGSGTDTANGGSGDDTCQVEYGTHCEHPSSATHLQPHPPRSHPDSVGLDDAIRDIEHYGDPDHPQSSDPAPGARVGDLVAVHTIYRHGRIAFRVRLRSLHSADPVSVGMSFQYRNTYQFLYGHASLGIPPQGKAQIDAFGGSEECDATVTIDREHAVARVTLDESCIDAAPWVRVAVSSSVSDDPVSPSYVDRDRAPEARGRVARFGPRAWRPSD